MSARRKARRAAKRNQNIPGMSQKGMKQAMNQMDVKEVDDVKEVIIKKSDSQIILTDATVQILKMSGQEIYTITTSNVRETSLDTDTSQEEVVEIEVSDADVKFISDKASVSPEQAREALIKSKGDLADALLSLTT